MYPRDPFSAGRRQAPQGAACPEAHHKRAHAERPQKPYTLCQAPDVHIAAMARGAQAARQPARAPTLAG